MPGGHGTPAPVPLSPLLMDFCWDQSRHLPRARVTTEVGMLGEGSQPIPLHPLPHPGTAQSVQSPGQYRAVQSKPWQETGPHTAWAGLALSTGFREILHKGPRRLCIWVSPRMLKTLTAV